MFSFDDLDADIQTRIPDRPARKVPVEISRMPEVPWLASNYEPKPSERPSFKSMIDRTVRTGIPLVGILVMLAIVGYGIVQINSLY